MVTDINMSCFIYFLMDSSIAPPSSEVAGWLTQPFNVVSYRSIIMHIKHQSIFNLIFCIYSRSEDDICGMLDFLIDNIFVMFSGCVFQQTDGIPMGTNCAPFSPIYSFIRIKLTSYRAFYREKRKSWLNLLVSRSAIQMMSFH